MKFTLAALFVVLASAAFAVSGYFPNTPLSPFFVEAPLDLTVWEGDKAVFRGNAVGNPGPTFQWRKNGVNIPGANLPYLEITNVSPADAGRYDVVASNRLGTYTSTVGVLTVSPAIATITAQPAGVVVDAGATTVLEVFTTGPRLLYQWKKDNQPLLGATHSSLTLIAVSAADAGTYSVVVTAQRNTVESEPAVVQVRPPPTNITTPPASAHVATGEAVRLEVGASGWNLLYQWKKDGAVIAGATTPSLSLAGVNAAGMGFYTVAVTGAGGAVESPAAIVTAAVAGGSRLLNASTRALMPPGGSLTPGFVLRGTGTKQVVVRAIGPTLGALGVASPVPDPRLELLAAGTATPLAANDDWGGNAGLAGAFARLGAFALPAASKDAAVQTGLVVNGVRGFSIRITSAGAGSGGVVLAEVYDADEGSSPVRIINLSALGFVGSGAEALTAGFSIAGPAPKQLLIRAAGPALAALGVGEALMDPRLAIVPLGQNVIAASNDDWDGSDELRNAFTAAGAFALAPRSKDAALVVRLPPGGYTVTISGAGNTTGTALVEIYDLDP